jgi:hypothetical protein
LNDRRLPVSPCSQRITIARPLVKEDCKLDKKKALKKPSKESQIREGKKMAPMTDHL